MDVTLVLFVSTAFLAVAGIVFVAGQYLQARADLSRRLPATAGVITTDATAPAPRGGFGDLLTQHFTEDRFGVDSGLRQKLKRDLLRAGFFSPSAIRYYLFARFCTVILLPLVVFLICRLVDLQPMLMILTVTIAAGIGVLGPDAYLARRQGNLISKNRLVFPDLLDLLNVCLSAGLSVEASFDRVRGHIGRRSPSLGRNIELMAAETRAGRSTIDALNSFADRLALDEAASFVSILRHSVELGGDVASALRIFGEEMRVKRMLLAEKKANELPVKMVLPLALGIFPVILMIVLFPIILKMVRVMNVM